MSIMCLTGVVGRWRVRGEALGQRSSLWVTSGLPAGALIFIQRFCIELQIRRCSELRGQQEIPSHLWTDGRTDGRPRLLHHEVIQSCTLTLWLLARLRLTRQEILSCRQEASVRLDLSNSSSI